MKVRFIAEARIDDQVAFEEGQVANLEDGSANRWIRRGKAVPEVDEEDEKLEEILDKVEDGKRVQDDTILKTLDAAVQDELETDSSDGAAKVQTLDSAAATDPNAKSLEEQNDEAQKDDEVANESSESEDSKKASKHHSRNQKNNKKGL
jgi:hypothetical protein